MVFGNNTASDISNLSKIPNGIWKILKYYAPVLPNTTCRFMLLFVYNRSREIFGNAQDTFLFTVEKKKNKVVYVRNNLFMKLRND